jgi:uncharacterized protein (DUF302 family)
MAGMIAGLAFAGAAVAQQPIVRYEAKGSFDAVKEDLALAIRDKGLVVDYTSHIGNMLERTGKDVGSARRIYDNAEALQFCSAVVSRRTMEADPANIAYCPYVIALYALPGKQGSVQVVYRRTLPEVDKLLDGIVRGALGL